MKQTRGLLIAAAVILGLTAIYWLIQGFGLIFSGATAGTYGLYLALAVIMVGLIFLSWRRSLLGGIITSTIGILMAVYFLMVRLNLFDALPFLLLMCVPLIISGLLFIEASWSTRQKSS
jgi:hypothetical protein